MRVVACLMLALCVGLLPVGCSSFNKQRSGGTGAAQAGGDGGVARGAAADTRDPLVRHATAQDQYGMLAGHVFDVDSNRPIDAYVRWEPVDDPKAEPRDVVATGGQFTIEGCQPGKQYKLTARAKRGDGMVAGISYVTAPSVVVLIKVSDRFVTPGTPALPGPPGVPDGKAEDKGLKKTGALERPGWEPGVGAITIPRAPDPARPVQPPQQSWDRPQGPPAGFVPNLADMHGHTTRPWEKSGQTPASGPTGAALPPSCNLMGNQVGGRLYNLALRDLGGEPWEWRTNRRGKLVLLDFWYSDCIHCVRAIPDLIRLQSEYGPHGLEIIGITCERYGTPQEQAFRAAMLCQKQQTNYRLLLAGGTHNPVPEQFGVTSFPSLFLLDENGTILWIHVGALRPDDDAVLRRLIERGLGVQKQ